MTTDRIPCFGTLALRFHDASTFDRLHSRAALLTETAREIDGIGGTERVDDEKISDLLMQAKQLVALAADALDLAVDAARDHDWTWQQVADALELKSKQAAQQRFGK